MDLSCRWRRMPLKDKIARLQSGKTLSATITKASSGKGKAPVTAVSLTSWHAISPSPDDEEVAVPPPVRKTRGPLAPSKTVKCSLPSVALPKAAQSPSMRKVPSSPNAKFFDSPKQKGGPRITAEDPIEDLANFEQRFQKAKCDRYVSKNFGHLCFYSGGALPCFKCGIDAAKYCFDGKATRSSKGNGKSLAANIINAAKPTTTSATLLKASASVPLVTKAKQTGDTSKLVRPAILSPVATFSKSAPSQLSRSSVPTQSRSTASLPGPSKSSSSVYKPLP
ncbi:hypothetical protein H0H93_003567 [Arthromyces matolae]|nr:hypothetical protein H0H93_003567 [Arthromyces matolae]